MKKVLSAEDRLDSLLTGLENQVLLASDDTVSEDVDAGDIRTVSEIIAGRLARNGRGTARQSPDLGSAIKRSVRSFITRPPVRPIGLSIAYSSDIEDEIPARRKRRDKDAKPD